MLASRTVCAQCRSRLLASAATIGTVRPNSTASFPSVAAENAPKATRPPQRAESLSGPSRIPAHKPRTNGNQSARKRALDLFESTINNSETQPVLETTQDVNQLYRLVDQLDKIMQNKENLSEVDVAAKSYALIATKLIPASRKMGGRLPHVLQTKASQALRKIADTKLATVDATALPSISDICKLHADLGQLKALRRLQLVNGLLNAIVSSRPDESNCSELESKLVDEMLLGDLVEFWKHFSGLKRADSGLESKTKFWLTTRLDMRGIEEPAKLFRALFPLIAINEMRGLAPALVATYVLLSESSYEHTEARKEAEPLLEALETIVKRFDRQRLQQLFEGYPELWEYVEPRADWRVIQMAPEAWKESSIPQADSSSPSQAAGRFSYALWHKRFSIAYRGNDHAAVQQAWRDLVDPANDKDRADRLRGCPELFDYILHISCHKSRYDRALYTKMTSEVLEYMKSLGLEPTVRTYTSMMEGWKLAKRLEPIEHLWKSLTEAGVILDRQIWSSRISALGSLGSPWDGIKALTHMDRVWNQAVEEGNQQTAVQPGIANVNAAISGLLRRDRMDGVRKVLVWANEKGLEPDIYTYNMLLSRMLKQGSSEEADKILNSMKVAGVTPDGATFTIILEAAFDDLAGGTPQEQRAAIDNVFKEMAACGIEPNQETYGKMLHTLIRAGDVAQASVAAVLAHLRGSGLQLSTEICTILVEYYVNRTQPDLDSIRALVADRRSRTRALTDRVFWETVIKHYHRAGDLDGALEIFYDLDDWGIWPGLPLLEPLLRSLVHRRDWDGAKKLVTTVRRQARPQAADRDSRYWKHAFWAAARDYDLLEAI
ncbi:glutathione s-transferase [Colletotrichum truncatum]|uniref:Glutathione s-transferase n=1 Tax=Colletotrichum truncatum TaxID=5467 RepID=A0ACC3YJ66_COLTU